MFPRLRGPLVMALAGALCGGGVEAQTSPPLWGKLRPGPYAVGFRSAWQRDFSHRYHFVYDDRTSYATDKAPRPILVSIRYPAKVEPRSTPMRHRDYLAIGSDDSQIDRFAAHLVEDERTTVCKELTGKPRGELSDGERQALDRFGETPTACHRVAPLHEGRFLLVVYHTGAQSSSADNAVYCKFLAGHGYVVIGSAFQDAPGREFYMGGGDGVGPRLGVPDRLRRSLAERGLATHRPGRPQRRRAGGAPLLCSRGLPGGCRGEPRHDPGLLLHVHARLGRSGELSPGPCRQHGLSPAHRGQRPGDLPASRTRW